jgi:hypothetical protein
VISDAKEALKRSRNLILDSLSGNPDTVKRICDLEIWRFGKESIKTKNPKCESTIADLRIFPASEQP